MAAETSGIFSVPAPPGGSPVCAFLVEQTLWDALPAPQTPRFDWQLPAPQPLCRLSRWGHAELLGGQLADQVRALHRRGIRSVLVLALQPRATDVAQALLALQGHEELLADPLDAESVAELAALLHGLDEGVLQDWGSCQRGWGSLFDLWPAPLRRDPGFWSAYRDALTAWLQIPEHAQRLRRHSPPLLDWPPGAEAADWARQRQGAQLQLRLLQPPLAALLGPAEGSDGVVSGQGLLALLETADSARRFFELREGWRLQSAQVEAFAARPAEAALADTSPAVHSIELFSVGRVWRMVFASSGSGPMRAGLTLRDGFAGSALTLWFGERTLRLANDGNATAYTPHDDGIAVAWLFELPLEEAHELARAALADGWWVDEDE